MKKIFFIVVAGWSFASQAMDVNYIARLIREEKYGIACQELPTIIGKKNTPLFLQLYFIQDLVDKLPYGADETKLKNKINELIASTPETTRTLMEFLIEAKTSALQEELAAKNKLLKESFDKIDSLEILLRTARIDEKIAASYEIIDPPIYPED